MADDPYVYPGTSTLRNLYEVRDPELLARLAADLTARRLAVLAHENYPARFASSRSPRTTSSRYSNTSSLALCRSGTDGTERRYAAE